MANYFELTLLPAERRICDLSDSSVVVLDIGEKAYKSIGQACGLGAGLIGRTRTYKRYERDAVVHERAVKDLDKSRTYTKTCVDVLRRDREVIALAFVRTPLGLEESLHVTQSPHRECYVTETIVTIGGARSPTSDPVRVHFEHSREADSGTVRYKVFATSSHVTSAAVDRAYDTMMSLIGKDKMHKKTRGTGQRTTQPVV
jgi:hypothetical protein